MKPRKKLSVCVEVVDVCHVEMPVRNYSIVLAAAFVTMSLSVSRGLPVVTICVAAIPIELAENNKNRFDHFRFGPIIWFDFYNQSNNTVL